MSSRCIWRVVAAGLAAGLWLGMAVPASGGGPRYVAGSSFFHPGVMGQPVRWAGGQVNYYVDQGPLNASIDNQHATAMVDAAAALWSAVPTAGVALVRAGSLDEDVRGTTVVPGNASIAQPSDVAPSSAKPLAIVYDFDGSVLDTVFGAYTSDTTNCENNGVMAWIDRFQPDATIGHAVMVLNGRCATTPNLVAMMQFQLARGFGSILGLGYAQVNPRALRSGDANAAQGWPIMQPISGVCGPTGGETAFPIPNI